MKFLVSLITVVLLTGSCNSQKQVVSEANKKDIKADSKQLMQTDKEKAIDQNYKLSVVYDASSRGFKKYIQISEDVLQLTNDRSLSNMQSYPIDSKEWDAIKSMIDEIDLPALKNLKAPTDKRLYDGAAHATLTVINGDTAYTSNSFDDGFPPEDIKALVNKMLAITEKVKKQ